MSRPHRPYIPTLLRPLPRCSAEATRTSSCQTRIRQGPAIITPTSPHPSSQLNPLALSCFFPGVALNHSWHLRATPMPPALHSTSHTLPVSLYAIPGPSTLHPASFTYSSKHTTSRCSTHAPHPSSSSMSRPRSPCTTTPPRPLPAGTANGTARDSPSEARNCHTFSGRHWQKVFLVTVSLCLMSHPAAFQCNECRQT